MHTFIYIVYSLASTTSELLMRCCNNIYFKCIIVLNLCFLGFSSGQGMGAPVRFTTIFSSTRKIVYFSSPYTYCGTRDIMLNICRYHNLQLIKKLSNIIIGYVGLYPRISRRRHSGRPLKNLNRMRISYLLWQIRHIVDRQSMHIKNQFNLL